MADTDLAKLSLQLLSSITVTISLWKGANPRYKDISIGYEYLQVLNSDVP